MTCAWCGRPIERTGARGPLPVYCSHSCREKAYRDRLLREAGRK